jgi:hypothetical protein
MMRAQPRAWVFFAALVACGPSGRGGDDVDHIEIAPPDLMVTITNGAAVTQPYTATYVTKDGDRSDVTGSVVFTLANTAFGNWSGATLAITGNGAGPTRVVATQGSVQGDTGLTVFVQGIRVDPTAPPNAPDLFGAATETAGHEPTIAYPAEGILVPPNLGQFDVHWLPGSNNNLFEVSMSNMYVDLKLYKMTAAPAYTNYTPAEWGTLASPSQPLTLTVAGMNTAAPTVKGTSPAQHVDVTNEIVQGGLYYWTTTPPQGIFRYDMGTPGTPPSSFFPPNMAPGNPTNCVGCHTLSKDGSKIAMTIDSGDGRGAMFNVADRSIIVPFATNTQRWNFATFTPDATKFVTVQSGQMVLRDANTGAIIGTPIPNTSGTLATHPEISPDGAQLANVETTGGGTDYDVTGGSIVTRTFDPGSNTFGPTKVLVANASGMSNFYPSWSPDGQWLLFTRTSGVSYSTPDAEVWVVKSDGSAPPIQLMAADTTTASITNSWARWTPFQESFGPAHQTVFYITFSTERTFGVRPLTTGTYGLDKQIWMAPFFPDKATGGMDPSGPAFRMPFQDFATSNHIAQWTQAVIIGRKADGSLLSQYEAVTGQAPRKL